MHQVHPEQLHGISSGRSHIVQAVVCPARLQCSAGALLISRSWRTAQCTRREAGWGPDADAVTFAHWMCRCAPGVPILARCHSWHRRMTREPVSP